MQVSESHTLDSMGSRLYASYPEDVSKLSQEQLLQLLLAQQSTVPILFSIFLEHLDHCEYAVQECSHFGKDR